MIIDRHISRAIGDDLIVTSKGAHRVFVLNPPAKFIWECLCSGISTSRIPDEMVNHFGIEPEIAIHDMRAILTEWRRAGLVPPEAPKQSYLLAGVLVTLYFSSATAQKVLRPLFKHLEIDDIVTRAEGPQVNFEIRDLPNAFEIISDGARIGAPHTVDDLLEMMTARFLDAVHEEAKIALSLHAAAIGIGGKCVLMPGRSGSGKSTLTAALVAAGHTYFTDDTAMLDEAFQSIPLPSPLVLKGKKWPSLAPILPDISHLPVHVRGGAEMRYWSPPNSRVARAPLPVSAIVFPTYRRYSPFHVEKLSASQSLERIVAASCMIRAPIDDGVLDELINWLEQVPSYAMTYGSLAEPMAFVVETSKS